jgi:hypothetical protein
VDPKIAPAGAFIAPEIGALAAPIADRLCAYGTSSPVQRSAS